MKPIQLRWLLLAPLAGCFGLCNPGNPVPPADSCAGEDTSGTVSALSVGTLDANQFTLYQDGDRVQVVTGGQGATMLPVRIHVAGAQAPACLAQMTSIALLDGEYAGEVGSSSVPLRTYPDGDGRTTRPNYIVLDSLGTSRALSVTVSAGGQTRSVELSIDGSPLPDLGPDLPLPDLPSAPDFAPPIDASGDASGDAAGDLSDASLSD